MQLRFRKSSCVATGTFNIYIIQPQMLREMGVIPEDTKSIVSGDYTMPGIRFELQNAVWIVRPDRLAVESVAPNIDCGSLVEKTLGALQWTPIMAVGINAVYACGVDAIELPSELQLPKHPDATQRSSHLAIPHDEGVLNILVAQTKDELEVSLNLNVDLNAAQTQGRSQKELNKSVRAICGSFMERRSRIIDMAKDLLKAELVYDR